MRVFFSSAPTPFLFDMFVDFSQQKWVVNVIGEIPEILPLSMFARRKPDVNSKQLSWVAAWLPPSIQSKASAMEVLNVQKAESFISFYKLIKILGFVTACNKDLTNQSTLLEH